MNNPKHTPGPWKILGPYKGEGKVHNWQMLTNGMRSPLTEEIAFASTEANARLIAAAPDMAEALGDMLTMLFEYTDTTSIDERGERGRVEKARAALAKARGEG